MEYHEVTEMFPLMADAEYQKFRSDIAANGQREPIYTWQGKIIDGRNRYRACLSLGIEPRFKEWDGQGDLRVFVVSLNLHRRHLNESQRAMVVANVATLERGGDRGNQHTGGKLQICSLPQQQAAEMVNVSERTVADARKVISKGAEELQKAVRDGEVAVSAAAVIADLPEEEQAMIVAGGKKAVTVAVKEIKAGRPRRDYEELPDEDWPPADRVLDEMTQEAQDMGFYDEPAEPVAPPQKKPAESKTLAELRRLWLAASEEDQEEFHEWIHSRRGGTQCEPEESER